MKIQAVILGLIMNSSNEIVYLFICCGKQQTPDHFFQQIEGGIEFSSPTHVCNAMQYAQKWRTFYFVQLLSLGSIFQRVTY